MDDDKREAFGTSETEVTRPLLREPIVAENQPSTPSVEDQLELLRMQVKVSVRLDVADGRLRPQDSHYELTKALNKLDVDETAKVRRAENDRKQAAYIDMLARQNARALGDMADGRDLAKKPDVANEKFPREAERHRFALHQQFEEGDAQGTVERAAGAECAMFAAEQKNRERRIENEPNADKKSLLKLDSDIRAAHFIAYTSKRIVDQGDAIFEMPDGTTETASERLEKFTARSNKLETRYKDVTRKNWDTVRQEDRKSYDRSLESARQEDDLRTASTGTKPETTPDTGAAEISDAKQLRLAKLAERREEARAHFKEAGNQVTRSRHGTEY